MSTQLYAERFQHWLRHDRMPITKGLALYTLLAYLAGVFGAGAFFVKHLAFNSANIIQQLWTTFSYPLAPVGGNILYLMFSLLWLWIAGGSVERSWGAKKYGVFLVLLAGASALGLLLGALLSGSKITCAGLWLPLAGITMAFAVMNPNQQVLFCFVLPIKLKYLAIISVASVLASYAGSGFVIAVFALAGCAFSLWFATRPAGAFDFGPARSHDNVIYVFPKKKRAFTNPFKSIKEKREQKKLKDLFERSNIEEK